MSKFTKTKAGWTIYDKDHAWREEYKQLPKEQDRDRHVTVKAETELEWGMGCNKLRVKYSAHLTEQWFSKAFDKEVYNCPGGEFARVNIDFEDKDISTVKKALPKLRLLLDQYIEGGVRRFFADGAKFGDADILDDRLKADVARVLPGLEAWVA